MEVHILATVRKEELLPAATLTFKTIRTGFPTAKICVTYNHLSFAHTEILDACLSSVEAEREPIKCATLDHHHWICSLIETESEPFWILDTDVVFFNSIEQFNFDGETLAGCFIPQFRCNFAKAITQPRLHTCLMRIDPTKVKYAIKKYGEQFPDCYATPRPTLSGLVHPSYITRSADYFFDTTSLLFHAINGRRFTDYERDAFAHLNSATLSDLVAPCYPEMRMRETQFAIFENPELARGSWKVQDAFYAQHAC